MPHPFVEQSVTFLYSDDLARHAAFYRDVMELPEVMDQGGCRIFAVTPTAFLGVCDLTHRPRGTKGIMFTFLCADVAAYHAHLLAKGVTFDAPPAAQDPAGTIVAAFFRDPAGYALEIQEFRTPAWPFPEGRRPNPASPA